MLDNANEGGGERRIGPSVSRDKWLSHARNKLQRGYVLIVGKGKRTANFYSREKGYEMCAFEVARTLVNSGEVVASGDHHLGTVYTLTDTSVGTVLPRPAPARADDDEAEDIGIEEEEAVDTFGEDADDDVDTEEEPEEDEAAEEF